MPSVVPFDCHERSEYSDMYYAVYGRVLTLAISFENLVKTLALLIESKSSVGRMMYKEKEYKKMIKKIYEKTTLSNNLENVCRSYDIDQDLKSALHSARKARNAVAHSLAVAVDERDEEKIILYQNFANKCATEIADGLIIVSTIINLITGDDVLTSEGGKRYKASLVKWACEAD